MAILSICPKCQASIQLSEDNSDPQDEVQCPKCKKTFLLHEALDIMAESPPEAVSVKKKAETPSTKNLGPASAGAAVPNMHPAPQAGAYDDEEDNQLVQPESTAKAASRRRTREPSMMGTMIGVVLGGAMGIYLGPYVLNYLGIPLPGPVRNLPGLAVAPDEKKEDEPKKKTVAKVEPPPEPPPVKAVEPPPTKTVEKPPEKTVEKTPAVEPKKAAPPAPEIGVKDAPSFTPAQLGTTLGEANKASGGQVGKSSGPALLDPAVYTKLCELAEKATFVRAESGDKTLEDRKRATQDVIKRVVSSQDNVVKLGTYGTQKLAESAPAERGIALCGVVQSIDQRGKLVAVELVLYGGGKRATVMCPIRGNMKQGDKVVILGTIVDNPSANLLGFTGDEPRVVWGGIPVPIPASTFQ